MGVFDKFLDAMHLDDDDDYDDDDYDYEEEEERKPLFGRRKKNDDDDYYEDEEPVKGSRSRDNKPVVKASAGSSAKLTPLKSGSNAVRRSGGAGAMEVCVIKPSTFEDAREVCETLLTNRTVILNMEGIDLALAQRIIDFTSGACYAIDGTLQKISNFIFILTPASVDISGDLQGIMDAFDFTGIGTGF